MPLDLLGAYHEPPRHSNRAAQRRERRLTNAPDFAVVGPFGEGWILETLAESVIAASPFAFARVPHRKGGTAAAVDALQQPPLDRARGVVFMHHIPLMAALERRKPHRDALFFGHYFDGPVGADRPGPEEMAALVRKAALIWTNAAMWDRWLVDRGVNPARISRIVHAVDSDVFALRREADHRKRITVGLVSQHHPRKNPAFIRAAVLRRDDVDWVLMGRNWGSSDLLRDCAHLSHFRFVDAGEVGFAAWPAVYRGFDIFCSPSFCEGGPFPLLEAMACGVWPIASATGFAPDIVGHGVTGHVHPIDDPVAFDACLDEAIAVARRRSQAVRAQVEPLSWARFGQAAAADLQRLAASAPESA